MKQAIPLLLFLTAPLWAAQIEGETKVKPYKIVRLCAKDVPAKAGIRWRITPDREIDRVTTNPTCLHFVAPPGEYRVELLVISVSPEGQVLISDDTKTVTIGEPKPPVPPVPPTPPDPPVPPPGPAPIPLDGFRALIIYESADLPKMPATQQAILFSKDVRSYLDARCAAGPDGKTKEWRIWDKDVDTTNVASHWQAAMKRERKSVPWLIISTGKAGWEGPLPADAKQTLDLLKKYGGA